jgi:single-strand DNA-binding protein
VAFHENLITMVGNLVDDPELRFTPSGAAVCNFRIASNRRWTGQDGQQNEETTYITCNVWRDMAENIGESLHKGDRVVVIGRIKVRSYENQHGQTVWVTEIEADEVAPSLRWARATVSRTSGGSGGGSGSGSGGGGSYGGSNVPPPPSDADVPF